ncbi:hypothetical protein F4821DRAFT_260553 [Hypoxylon rubiginosum]|uniref:Uncharacterized protein n=1 Tax=Hypoxylon rubiginosum TaxID=110542 RepID=A0ACC0CZG1_9PEZI|nr:hypothetical protein F4821DRAFT_260553 [Hypoxylon rubiginosum]
MILLCYFLLIICANVVGGAYFASIINQELKPYFDSHGMQQDASDARQAFGYLVASAVLSGLSLVGTLWNLCRGGGSRDDEDDGKKGGLCSELLSVSAGIVMIVFACLTTEHSWGWWRYFASEDSDHLAAASQELAAFLITVMVLSAVGSVARALLWIRG